MADQSQPSTMFHNFDLPHGNDNLEDGGSQKFMTFEEGFSDDEGRDVAFDRSFPGPKSKSESPKGKKSPRQSGDDDDSELDPKAKKARIQSLFGGSYTHSDEDADDEEQLVTKDSGHGNGIGMRMSSLTLEQDDNGEGPSRPLFDLGATLGLSDKEDSPALSDLDQDDLTAMLPGDDPVDAYGLRKNIDRMLVATTWLDVDQSGNYDPQEETRKKMLRLNKAKAKAKAKDKDKKQPRKHKGKEKQQKPRDNIVLKKIVKFRFMAFGTVLNILNGEENWPDGWSIIDSDEEREQQEFRSFYRHSTPGIEPQEPILDPKGEEDDLTGYPIARGCKDCRKYDQECCSAIENGTFPCTQCIEDDLACQPIIEPGSPSSYHKTDRVDLDRILYGPNRPFVSCTYCRTYKKRCSVKKKEDKPPCKQCKKNRIGCTFYDAPKLEPSSKKAGKRKVGDNDASKPGKPRGRGIAPEVSVPGHDFFDEEDIDDLERMDDEDVMMEVDEEEIEMEDAEGHAGVLTKIQTSFAHPIKFYTVNNAAPDCNFCELPVFGFVGHFEKTVHVLKWSSGLGYTEFAAGHREEHEDPDTMCQDCVMDRVQVIYCEGHTIEPFEDVHLTDTIVDDLINASARSISMKYQLKRWCSFCFTPATFKCCSAQPSIVSAEGEEEELIDGCGLRLCDRCEARLREHFGGDVQEMAATLDYEPKPAETVEGGIIRADVGFLAKDGLLMRNVESEV